MTSIRSTAAIALATAGLLAGCGKTPEAAPTAPPQAQIVAADTIYTGGDIVTVNDAQPTAEALAVKDGKILAVGDARRRRAGPQGRGDADRRSGGKALLPGFLDAHSHYISSLTVANQVNVYAPPAGPGQGPREHRRRAGEVPRREQDPEGRGDPGLRLRRERHAERPPAEPRRSRQGVPGQPGAGRARVDARRGAELGGAEEVEHLGRDQDAAGRRHRPQAGHERALGPDHGDRVPADLRLAAQADARAGGRVVARRADALRPGRHHHGPRRAPRTPTSSRS